MEKSRKIYLESKVFMWLIVLLPVFSMYKSPVNALDLGTFIFFPAALICYFINVARNIPSPELNKHQKRLLNFIILLFGYILFITFANMVIGLDVYGEAMSGGDKLQMLFRCLKLIITSVLIIFCGKRLMSVDYFMKCYGVIVICAVVYLFLQTIVYYTLHMVLPPFISSLIREDYAYVLDYSYHQKLGLFRPMSFFYEPAHFSEFCIPYLAYLLFAVKSSRKGFFSRAVFVTAGIILSTSGVGCLMALIMWVAAFIKSIYITNKYTLKIKIISMIGICCIPILFFIPLFQQAVLRLFSSDGSVGAILIRMGSGYEEYLQLGWFFKIFGIGYGNYPPSYAISLSYSLVSLGIAGTGFLAAFFVKAIIETDGFQRALSFIWILMFFVTMIFNTGFTLYLPCIFFILSQKEGESNV